MGTTTFVEQPSWQGAARQLRVVRQGLDFILVGVVVALTLFGLLMVYSAGPKFASYMNMPTDYFLIRQLMWAGVGVLAIVLTTLVNYHFYQKITVLLMLATLASLIVVMLLGRVTLGSVRYPGIKIHDTRIIRLLEALLHGGNGGRLDRQVDSRGRPHDLPAFAQNLRSKSAPL